MPHNTNGELLSWHCLALADGPLAGATHTIGWYLPEEIPQRITVMVGIRRQPDYRVQDCTTGEWLDTVNYSNYSKARIVDPGRPVRYQLDGDAYRYVGDGAWPEHEVTPEPESEVVSEVEIAGHELTG